MMYSIHVLFDNANMKTTMSIILPKTSQAIMRIHFRIITCMSHSGVAKKRRARCCQKQRELFFLGKSGIFHPPPPLLCGLAPFLVLGQRGAPNPGPTRVAEGSYATVYSYTKIPHKILYESMALQRGWRTGWDQRRRV